MRVCARVVCTMSATMVPGAGTTFAALLVVSLVAASVDASQISSGAEELTHSLSPVLIQDQPHLRLGENLKELTKAVAECRACPGLCPAGLECTSCDDSTGTRECHACADGTFSGAGVRGCQPCPAGHASSAGSSSCAKCPAGLSSAPGAAVCTPKEDLECSLPSSDNSGDQSADPETQEDPENDAHLQCDTKPDSCDTMGWLVDGTWIEGETNHLASPS